MTLNCNGKILDLQTKKIMGIINLSQDSFYDGGKNLTHSNINKNLEKIIDMIKLTLLVKITIYGQGSSILQGLNN